MNRFALGLGVFLLLVVLIIVIFFRGDDNNQKNIQQVAQIKSLEKYADVESSRVTLTTRGKVNGEDIHRSIAISVSPNYRQIEVIGGYNGNVLSTQSYSNTEEAYRQFLHAIKDAGFLTKNKDVSTADASGKCPLGQVYFFGLTEDFNELSNLWSASCAKIGTSGGNKSLIQTLFRAQITNYSQITSGISL